jgi:spermidine/putrescine transport system ATP-binding protein
MAEFLEFDGLFKHFGPVRAVDGVSLSIRRGECFSLLGPSGCGKTTLLRLMAGFEQPDAGRILLDGRDISKLPPHRRNVNTVFQNYALFPHLSVRGNIAFGLEVARRPRREIRGEVDRMLDLIQMGDQADKRPDQISGGQKQRVAIARALVNKPRVLLLDEPLAALDLKLRQRMLIELDAIHDEVGITFLYVTHDQTEAMSLSDRIAVMHNGRIEQIGAPAEIYEAPRSSFVAAFIGDTNFFDGRVESLLSPDRCRLAIDGLGVVTCLNDKQKAVGDRAHLSLRPERIQLDTVPVGPREGWNSVRGTVEDIVYAGQHTRYGIRLGTHRIAVHQPHARTLRAERAIRRGDGVWLSWEADAGCMLEQYDPDDEHVTRATAFRTPAGPSAAGAGDRP